MRRCDEIQHAYQHLGKEATFYDGMITCSTRSGRLVCALVWNMNREKNARYLEKAMAGIPQHFCGRILEVPVGTGVLTMPLYKTLPQADVICLDYSADMMKQAQQRALQMELENVRFQQGDVSTLPFDQHTFDLVLSLNGFHAFPDKEAAYQEIFRVLKPGGIFCGCFYVEGQNRRTDWLIRHLYVPIGFFTPPFETEQGVIQRLSDLYATVQVETVEAMVCFTCRKGWTI